MFFEHNTRCRTLHALATTRTRQESIPFLSKIGCHWSICQSRTPRFDGAKATTWPWEPVNDPVMGGESTSTFKVPHAVYALW